MGLDKGSWAFHAGHEYDERKRKERELTTKLAKYGLARAMVSGDIIPDAFFAEEWLIEDLNL